MVVVSGAFMFLVRFGVEQRLRIHRLENKYDCSELVFTESTFTVAAGK